MFGYVTINQKEMKFKEYDVYRAYYCGQCRALKERHGFAGQLTLSYDTTFLILLLTSLYEPKDVSDKCRCIAHPFEKHPTLRNEFTDYSADINIMLSYYSCLDDWSDERKFKKLVLAKLLAGKNKKAAALYEKKARCIYENLNALHLCEKTKETDLDKAAGFFGEIMAEIFDYKDDIWSPTLRHMGFFLGKFIYLMDAFEDLEEDSKKGCYNPFIPLAESLPTQEFDRQVKDILTMMMAECCKAFERLPIVENASILRNILYSGVWSRYQMVVSKREKEAASDAETAVATTAAGDTTIASGKKVTATEKEEAVFHEDAVTSEDDDVAREETAAIFGESFSDRKESQR